MSTDATEPVLRLPLLTARRRFVLEEQRNLVAYPDSDEELLRRVQDGDEIALHGLFERHRLLAFSIARNVLRDQGEAEDLVQEIFFQLHNRKNTFDPAKGSARTWLVQMIYRRAFDRRTYLRRRQFYSGTDFEEQTNAIQDEKSFEEEVIERLTVEQLKTAFAELPVRQRETLDLFFFEGLTLPEIAERLGESVPNTRHNYYRGLERLRIAARAMMQRNTGGPKSES